MALRGHSLASAVLLVVALAIAAPAFKDAASNFSYGDWTYGPFVALVLKYIPLILAVGALLLLSDYIRRSNA